MGYRYGDAGNLAVRVFLRELGAQHDRSKLSRAGVKLESKNLKPELKDLWNGKCAYCDSELGIKFDVDHVVPINQKSAGLHCIANVVPVCMLCNKLKKSQTLEEFLESQPQLDSSGVLKRVQNWEHRWGGNPSGTQQVAAEKLHQAVSSKVREFVDSEKSVVTK
jgi:HNH endonuclease